MSSKTRLFVQLLVHLYGWLLRLYPPHFRDEFGPEMGAVFRQAAESAARQGFWALFAVVLSELLSLPGALRSQNQWKGAGMIEQKPAGLPASQAGLPFGQVVMGLLPLAVIGLGMALIELPVDAAQTNTARMLSLLVPYLFALVFLLVGWLKNFPRWVYPYAVYSFVFTLYISVGLVDLRGWRSFVPLGLTVALALLLTRPPARPLMKMLKDVWNDWSLLAFGLYGLLPLVIFIVQDEISRSYSFPATASAAVIMLAGAAFYLGAPKSGLRTAGLLAGAFFSVLAASIGTALYWQTHSVDMLTYEHSLITGPVPWASVLSSSVFDSLRCILILLLVPGMVGLIQWYLRRQQSQASGPSA